MATKRKEKKPAKNLAEAAIAKYGATAADLPAHVLAQLNLSSNDDLASQVIGIFDAATEREGDTSLSIDDVIIELWKKHKQETTRDAISRLLAGLSRRKRLSKVEGRKGRYKLPAA